MHPRKRVDPTFHRLNVGFYVFPARQSNDGLRQCQRILGAMIDLAGQQILTFFRLLALGDVNGDAADPHDTAAVVDRCRGGADAPADIAVRPFDPEFGFVRRYALGELGDGLSQFVDIVRMEQRLNACRCRHEGFWIDAEDAVLALVPHPVAVDPAPVPGAHSARGDRQAASFLAFQKPRVGLLQLRGAGSNAILKLGMQTATRMTATSFFKRYSSASRPEDATTRFSPSSLRITS